MPVTITVPVQHNAYLTTEDHRTFTGGCHQCDWTAKGEQSCVIRARNDHQAEWAVAVAAYWSTR